MEQPTHYGTARLRDDYIAWIKSKVDAGCSPSDFFDSLLIHAKASNETIAEMQVKLNCAKENRGRDYDHGYKDGLAAKEKA